jgi:hypothetical protein
MRDTSIFSNASATLLQSQNSTSANLASLLHTIPPFMAVMKLKEIQRTQPQSADFRGQELSA